MSCEIQPARHNHQPTHNRALNKPAWPGPNWPKMPVLGQIWSFLGKKSFFFTGEIKSFVTHITKNPPRHLVHIVFLVRHWTKCAKNGNIWPKMTKNAYFGPILAVLGPNILIFMGVSKSFGTNITENHLGNLSALFFGQALDQMGQKCWYLAQNASFGPNLAVFGPEIHFFWGRE